VAGLTGVAGTIRLPICKFDGGRGSSRVLIATTSIGSAIATTLERKVQEGVRIYNLFPTLVGTTRDWEKRLPEIAEMGFNWVFLNPVHLPGESGSLYAIKDYYQLNPAFLAAEDTDQNQALRRFFKAAETHGLQVMLDLVINHTAKDSVLVEAHPDWYLQNEQGHIHSPYAVDPTNPDNITVWHDLAEIDYSDRPARRELLNYWQELIAYYLELGCHGFRCDAAYQVPGDIWKELIEGARQQLSDVKFFAETLGASTEAVMQLWPAGFDYFFNSAKWWDFRGAWLLEQYERFRSLAPSVAFPETHDTARVAAEHPGDAREARFQYLFAASFAAGVMLPIGYEFGFSRPLHVVETRPEHWEAPAFDIREFISAVNQIKTDYPVLSEEGPQHRFTDPMRCVVGLLRRAAEGSERVATLINPDPETGQEFPTGELTAAMQAGSGDILEITPAQEPATLQEHEPLWLEPRSIRLFWVH